MSVKTSEERHRLLAETMLQGVVHQDASGAIIAMNPAAERILGMSREQFVGGGSVRELLQTIHEDGSPFPGREHPAMVALQTGQTVRGVVMGVCNPLLGIDRWLSIDAVPVIRPGDTRAAEVYTVFEDITERKRAAQMLQESQQLLQDVIDGSPSPIFLKDSAGKFLTINTSLERMLGISREEIKGKTDYDIASPEVADYWRAHDSQVMETGEAIQIEEVADLADGHHIFLANKFPLVNSNGQIYGVGAISHDITERKRMEAALLENEHRFRQHFTSLNDGFYLSQILRDEMGRACDYRYLEVNPAFEQVMGLSRDQIVGKRYKELSRADPVSGWLEIFSQVATTGVPANYCFYSNTYCRHFETFAFRPAEDQFAVLVTDVTERKRAEESKAALAAIVESSGDAIIGKTLDGTITSWNGGAQQIFGFRADEMVGQPVTCIIPSDLQGEEVTILERLRCGQSIAHYETVRLAKDGRHVPVSLTISAIQNASGTIIGASKIARDITERKRAEERIAASLREKEVMLKEIHHRVKNNLQVISSLLNLQTNSLDDPALRGLFQDMRDRVRSMALVHEKLYQSESLASVDFAEYARSLIGFLSRAHSRPQTKVGLALDLKSVSLPVERAVPCGLILNELLTNAFKHAFRGRAQGEITTTLDTGPHRRVCLRVSDNGVGLPAGVNWRESSSLGLRLIHLLAGQLDATVEVCAGGGTDFLITFEQSQPEQPEHPQASPHA